jgi:hypothetical protein
MKNPKAVLAMFAVVGAGAAVATAVLAAQTAPLPPPPAAGTSLPPGQCILSRDIQNHVVADRHTLLLAVKGDVYRVTVGNNCLATAINNDPIVLEHPGTTFICKPVDLDITVSRGGAPSRCITDSLARLTPEEVAALPKQFRP